MSGQYTRTVRPQTLLGADTRFLLLSCHAPCWSQPRRNILPYRQQHDHAMPSCKRVRCCAQFANSTAFCAFFRHHSMPLVFVAMSFVVGGGCALGLLWISVVKNGRHVHGSLFRRASQIVCPFRTLGPCFLVCRVLLGVQTSCVCTLPTPSSCISPTCS
jgi:hypothetical protein